MAHPYPPHLSNFEYVGKYMYSLTFCTARGTRPFQAAANVRLVLQQFLRASDEKGFELTAYCFMPDHVHLLACGLRDDSDCRGFIKVLKQYAGYYFKRSTGEMLWQRYGYEHVLRSDIERATTIRYILDNPLRAGLTKRLEDYPFVGSERYTLDELVAQATRSDEARLPMSTTASGPSA